MIRSITHKSWDLDKQTFSEYYLQYYKLIVYKFVQNGLNQEEAEEAAQEVFGQAYQKRAQFRGRNHKAFIAWVSTIQSNYWKNYLRAVNTRKRKVETMPHLDMDREEYQDHETPEWQFLQHTSQQDILAAIGKLPDHLRETLILMVFHSYSYAEIASLTKASESQVRNRLFQARSQLRDLLGR